MRPSRTLLREAARPSARALPAPATRRLAPLLLLLLLLGLWAALFALPARAQDLGPDAQAILTAINEARAANNLLPVRVNAQLNQAAQNHVDDLVANGIYGHYGSDGSNVRTRVARTGYPSGWVSENWVTSGSPASAMNWWMNDWIHRVNILTPHWDEVGVGIAALGNGYFIYVTDFANSTGQPAQVVEPTGLVTDLSGGGTAADTVQVPAGGMDYVIQGGDTLFGIALRYGLDWQDIAVANGLGEFDLLSIGRTIRLPGVGNVGGPVAAGGLRYTVSPGDTLIGIASRYAIAWEDIASANGLGEWSVLQIGMTLRLPGVPEEEVTAEEAKSEVGNSDQLIAEQAAESQTVAPQAAAAAPQESSQSTGQLMVTVQAGETAWSIAAEHGLGVDELLAANGLGEDDVLAIGRELTLPGVAAPEPAAPAEAAEVAQASEVTEVGEVEEMAAASAASAASTVTAAPAPAEPVVAPAAAPAAPAAPKAPALAVGVATPPAQSGFNVSFSASPWSPAQKTVNSEAVTSEAVTAETVAAETVAAGTVAAEKVSNGAAAGRAQYVVQPGDTVWSIAARTGVNWRTLLALNGMTEDSLLQVGQTLLLE